jgi:5-methyltetrahydropteroyltriglutamate--homocysteine methyltransferase
MIFSSRQQAESGIDIITDGEQSKIGFFAYVQERLGGFEPMDGPPVKIFAEEVEEFPEYEDYFGRAMLGRTIAPRVSLRCTGPIRYLGQEAIRRDIDNLKAALSGLRPSEVFLPAVAPSGVGENGYYKTDEEYWHALADAMRSEYQAIVDAGFLLQIDDPFLTDILSYPSTGGANPSRKPKCMWRQSISVCAAFRLKKCGFTPATASTKGRECMTHRFER